MGMHTISDGALYNVQNVTSIIIGERHLISETHTLLAHRIGLLWPSPWPIQQKLVCATSTSAPQQGMPRRCTCECSHKPWHPIFFAWLDALDMFLTCVAVVTVMQLSGVWVWLGERQAAAGYLAHLQNFCHHLQLATNFHSRLHTVNAEVTLSRMMPVLLPCTGCRGLECLTWCPNFEAL